LQARSDMAYSKDDWVIICLCIVVPILLAMALYGARLGWQITEASLSDFVTAKKKFELPYIAPAFFFAGLGSWVINKPGAYASTAGVLGLCMYGIWAGLAVIIIAFLGKWIRGAVDGAESISDFVSARFGQLAELYIACLVLFNTSVLLIAEYTNIRQIFIAYVRSRGYAIILIVGFTALMYVALGGLKSVIQVHPVQGVVVAVASIMVASYVGARFTRKLPENLTDLQKGYTPTGYSSILLQPIVLISSAFFNEALWQKCWAAKGTHT
jgi:Na+/pantothenate symporter